MPVCAPLRLIKRCLLFQKWDEKDKAKSIPNITRGVYVLYKQKRKEFNVFYIGVAGVKKNPKKGIGSRLSQHARDPKKQGRWTHYSAFEVHDNITTDDILELEGLLLRIFRYDPRIKLDNRQGGSKKFDRVRGKKAWKPER